MALAAGMAAGRATDAVHHEILTCYTGPRARARGFAAKSKSSWPKKWREETRDRMAAQESFSVQFFDDGHPVDEEAS